MVKYRVYQYKNKTGKRIGYDTFETLAKAKNSSKRLKTLYGYITKISKIK